MMYFVFKYTKKQINQFLLHTFFDKYCSKSRVTFVDRKNKKKDSLLQLPSFSLIC